jgi:hypothetical protein
VNATPIANRSLEFLPVLPEEDLPPELPPDILSQVVLNLTPYLQPPFSPDDVTDVLQTFFSLTPFYDLTNERTEFLVYDNSIPQSTLDFFQNGVNKSNDLLSNPFEIQFRSYSNSPHIGDMSKMNTTAIDLYVQQLVLDTGYIVREGIIVDLDHGGVGFRNHTVPISTSAASMWSEELLWLVPLTSCIGTNWTIYSHPQLTPGQNTGPQFVVSDFKLVYENHNNSSPDPHGDFGFDTRLQKAAKSFDFEIRKYGNLTDSPREAEINSSVFSDNRSLDVIFFNSGDELQILQFQDSEVGIETSGGENNSLSLSSPRKYLCIRVSL